MMRVAYRSILIFGVLGFISTLLIGCAETEFIAATAKRVTKSQDGQPTREEWRGVYKVGNPYKIGTTWYYPAVDYDYSETGIASWYGPKFHGKKTANGERFDMNELTAAHRTLPMPSFVRVTNLENGRSIVLRVNDRGPFARGRIIDVSRRASQLLGFEIRGTARVKVEILEPQSRSIAALMQGQTQIASIGSPITVDRLPTVAVDAEKLPPPPGIEEVQGEPNENPSVAAVQPSPRASPVDVNSAELDNPVIGKVTATDIQPTALYVQVGAYTVYQNAHRARAMVSSIGPTEISPVLVNDRDFFRVRVGPISEVEQADVLLERIINAGYSDAKIIVVN